jgi:hypothetical protein
MVGDYFAQHWRFLSAALFLARKIFASRRKKFILGAGIEE